MKKLKDLFLPYTIREKLFFFYVLWFLFALTLVLGIVWHPVFFVFSGIVFIFTMRTSAGISYCTLSPKKSRISTDIVLQKAIEYNEY